VPFKGPQETIDHLKSLATEDGGRAAILADDGEKFGAWPGTKKWVYEDGWLENFLKRLDEDRDSIRTMTFSEYMDEYPPRGSIYLPAASYPEMMEWALPPEAGHKYAKMAEELKSFGKYEEYQRFLHGGFFRNFFVKYPESNNMHKKMLFVSEKISALEKGKKLGFSSGARDSKIEGARRLLWKGQCNSAYWHGASGGLYLPHLRHAVYENLIAAEVEADRIAYGDQKFIELRAIDLDRDGADELLVSNNMLSCYFCPAYGGSLFELDYKPKNFNLLNGLSRKDEVSDWHRRLSLLDHFLPLDTDIADFMNVKYREQGDFIPGKYLPLVKKTGSEIEITLKRKGTVNSQPVEVVKVISIFKGQSLMNIRYTINNISKERMDAVFGVEFNFSMLAGNSPDRHYAFPGIEVKERNMASIGEIHDCPKLKIIDELKGFSVSLESGSLDRLWRFPIETVARSEAGFERTYQSSLVFPNKRVVLEPGGTWTNDMKLIIE
jgi:alpha-amylase